tara:strand:+ start:1243 stop:1470 length:228 start_codon:yes stop_codon:yes gene_type:complete
MRPEEVIEGLRDEEREALLVGCGVFEPKVRRDLWNGRLAWLSGEGRRLMETMGERSIATLKMLGRLYLENLGVKI